jgi:hypothetical protein
MTSVTPLRSLAAIGAVVAACALAVACSSSGHTSSTGGADGGGDGPGSHDGTADGSDGGAPGDARADGDAAASTDSPSVGDTGQTDASTDGPASEAATIPTCDAGVVGAGDRVITVLNDCPGQTIAVGINGGYVQDCNAGACPSGMTCLTSRNPPGCFWDFPPPSCGTPVLGPGASATYVLDAPAVANVKWSGNVYAATQCDGSGTGCLTAECATSVAGQTVVGACPDGTGPQGPTTLAEFTLVPNGADYYDVSSINGVNVPISMAAIGGAADPSNPYTCATAGAVTPSAGLVGCPWTFDTNVVLGGTTTDESTLLRAVAPGGAACTSSATCGAGEVCGTAVTFGGSAATQSCGKQVAWWTADELCAYTGNAMGAPVSCGVAVAGQGDDANLYGCNGANAGSCYSTNADSTCCGCPDWVIGGQTLDIPAGFACHGTNASWTLVAEPWAAFLKNACPTAYSFPFDDATSTFTCATPGTSGSTPNGAGYAITFCPGGKDGT